MPCSFCTKTLRLRRVIKEAGLDFWHSDTIPDVQPGSENYSLRRALWDALETILLSLLLFGAINFLSARIRVESISMEPNLVAGDMVIVNKLAYRFDEPKRGDIIVFRYPPDPDQTPYIKRVIGLPGDQVRINNGAVYINGVQIREPYLSITTERGGNWTVPEEALFVMGDNRNNSSDSRAWGMVPMENVIGKAEVIYWPMDHWAILNFPAAVAAQP
jgi:signal peptidase I